MARPMPLEAPVTRAARAGMGANQSRPGLLSVAMPLVIIAVLAVVLAAAALVFDGGDEGTAAAPPRPAPLAQIVARVEQERGLRFRQVPDPLVVTPEQAQDEALESFDEDYPPARRRADEQVLGLLGLLPPGTDLRKVAESTYGEAVAGYYDPRSGRLRVVQGAQTGNRVLYEMTLAHELDHALEDQRLRLDADAVAGSDDASLAYTALVEGSATALMYRYVDDRFGDEETFGGLAASAFAPTGNLPPYLMAQLVFPYTQGETFVNRLLELGSGGWSVVDTALRDRPPASTEQVMHPQAYIDADQPRRVRIAPPGGGWRVLRGGTLGEWTTGKLLARAGGTAWTEAAAGWGGDRYALLGRGADRALVVRWIWDTPADEREFLPALRDWVEEGKPESSSAAIAASGGAVTLAIAPGAAQARALARRAASSPRLARD